MTKVKEIKVLRLQIRTGIWLKMERSLGIFLYLQRDVGMEKNSISVFDWRSNGILGFDIHCWNSGNYCTNIAQNPWYFNWNFPMIMHVLIDKFFQTKGFYRNFHFMYRTSTVCEIRIFPDTACELPRRIYPRGN